MISSLYWKIRYYIRDRYINMKYLGKEPKIRYDKWLDEYICSSNINETGEVEYVASELVRYGLTYHYYIDGELTHDHMLSGVLVDAYNNAETFRLCLDYNEYTEQERVLIEKLIEKGKCDRKHWMKSNS